MSGGAVPEFRRAAHIPAADPPRLELVPVVAATIDAKLASQMVKDLCQMLPLPDLRHLKRMRRSLRGDARQLDALLCELPAVATSGATAAPEQQQQQQQQLQLAEGSPLPEGTQLPDVARKLVEVHGLSPFVALASRHAPVSRDHLTGWGQAWPINWRVPDTNVAQAHVQLQVTDQQQQEFCRRMARALQLAAERGVSNAAVVVDPAEGVIVGEGWDCSASHPLQHACMNAIKAVATRDLRLWPPPTSGGGGSGGPRCDMPPNAEDGWPAKRPRTDSGSGPHSTDDGGAVARQDAAGASTQPQCAAEAGAPFSKPYLCTGYELYVVREPCIMCAMAAVHSRLKTVVFCLRDERHGALSGAAHKLQAQRSLNHHYTVFHLPLAAATE